MAFICPDCEQRTLEIVHSIELGSDGAHDEYSLQSLLCKHCALLCVAEYCESRRGARESWSHMAYRLSRQAYQDLNGRLSACPTPRNPHCTCATHQYFGVKERDRLRPLSRINHDKQVFHLKVNP